MLQRSSSFAAIRLPSRETLIQKLRIKADQILKDLDEVEEVVLPLVKGSFLRKSGCVKQKPCPVGTYDNSPVIHRWEWMHRLTNRPID